MVRLACAAVTVAIVVLASGCPPICTPTCEGRLCGDDGCGGSCGTCLDTHDCIEFACVVRPTCVDILKNGLESDVDCGGGACPGCADGRACTQGSDCASGRCEAGVCSSCVDGVRNGPESDVDCGGDCRKCRDGLACRTSADCDSGRCDGAACGSCKDGIRNGPETDVDCAGGCALCKVDDDCRQHADCASRTCIAFTCEDPTCTDVVHNQDETDLDCGGAVCTPCALGLACLKHTDCAPGACFDSRCAVAECHVQRDCGDVVNELEARSCVDKRCKTPWPVDGAGKPLRRDVTFNLVYAQVFALSSTPPKTTVIRVVNPVKTDGTRITCADLKAASGATEATRNRIDTDPNVNQVYRNLYSMTWQPNVNVFDILASVPRVAEAIVFAEAWYGPRSSMMPTGNRASVACVEGVKIADLTGSVRVNFNP